MECLIRNYKTSDYAILKELLVSADMFDETWDSENNYLQLVKNSPEAIQVAEIDKIIAGCIIITSLGSNVSLFFRLAVKAEFRGKHVGSQLLAKAEEIAKTHGSRETAFFVAAENTILRRFYTLKGYKTTDKKYICMWKKIE